MAADRWRSRGYLPHFEAANLVQHVTFHLADGLPATALRSVVADLASLPPHQVDAERRRRMEAWLDAGHGACLLAHEAAARLVEDALLHFDGERYRLLAWVVMPNHVHVAVHTLGAWQLGRIVGTWKSYTARRLPQSGPVWRREYWDRYIRDDRHLQTVIRYIHLNPVRAGLVARPEDWPFSSARFWTEAP